MDTNSQLILNALKELSQYKPVQAYGDSINTILEYAKNVAKKNPLQNTPIAKAMGNVMANPTPQEVGSQAVNMSSAFSKAMGEATQDPMTAALNFTPMGVAGFTKPLMTGYRRAIPLTNQGKITQEQIPILKELGIFDKSPEYQQMFVKQYGAELRHIANKAKIHGWDMAKKKEAVLEMVDRGIAEKVAQGPQQVMYKQ